MREQGCNCNRQNQWNGNSRQMCRGRNNSYYNSMYQNRQNYPMKNTCSCGNEYSQTEQEEMEYVKMGCGKQTSMESGVDRMKPGMGYVPWQKFQQLLDPEDALKNGTIFKELVLPYTGIRGRGGNCNG